MGISARSLLGLGAAGLHALGAGLHLHEHLEAVDEELVRVLGKREVRDAMHGRRQLRKQKETAE